jgi:hypothetical protein
MDLMTKLRSQLDRTLACLAGLAGVVVLIIGWLGVSGTAYPAEQLPYLISGGIGGLFLLGVSTAMWLSADLHDEWRKLDRIEEAIRHAGEVAEPAEFEVAGDADRQTQQMPLLAAEAGR